MHDCLDASAGERRSSREKFVQQSASRVYVGPVIDRIVAEYLLAYATIPNMKIEIRFATVTPSVW
jgi:hypothetical protein